MTPPSFRDIETLTAYLDGQLDSAHRQRLESRLGSEPELKATLDALRESRAVLRRLPQRRAPRNFTLTPKMAGIKPPLPRSYPNIQIRIGRRRLPVLLRLRHQLPAAPLSDDGRGCTCSFDGNRHRWWRRA